MNATKSFQLQKQKRPLSPCHSPRDAFTCLHFTLPDLGPEATWLRFRPLHLGPLTAAPSSAPSALKHLASALVAAPTYGSNSIAMHLPAKQLFYLFPVSCALETTDNKQWWLHHTSLNATGPAQEIPVQNQTSCDPQWKTCLIGLGRTHVFQEPWLDAT